MSKFNVGDAVQRLNAADQIGIVVQVRPHPQAGTFFYDVAIGPRTVSVPEEVLRAFRAAPSAWAELQSGVASGVRAFRRSLTYSRVSRPPSRIAKSFSSARTQFYPHQFKPLLKLLDSPQRRLLIADDVGLGKTIEAGYILTELEASRRLDGVLIVVPARLRSKWQLELDKRFGQRFELVDGARLRSELAEGRAPASFHWIVSYESVRRYLLRLQQSTLTIDCLVFDEAHRLRTPAAQQHKVGALLCERADAVVMLSATPIQTSLFDLFNLAKLLLPNEFSDASTFEEQMDDNRLLRAALDAMRAGLDSDEQRLVARTKLDDFVATRTGQAFADAPLVRRAQDLLATGRIDRQQLTELQAALGALSPISHFFTRTRKVEAIPDTPQREAAWISVELKGAEKTIYETIVAACRARAQEADWAAAQSMTMVYRAVASCIPAAMRQFQAELQHLAPPKLEEPEDDDESGTSTAPAVDESLQAAIREAVRLFQSIGATDTKLSELVHRLRSLWENDRAQGRGRRKCIVFSYFRGTVEYVADALTREGIACRRVHGGVPAPDREGIVDAFLTDPAVDVLVTSDVSAEGVDLQVASVLFNYDLPWNPMVVEQRIGRIDRIGQDARVLVIVNLVVKGSIEERILKRLFERVHIFENAVGELDEIFGSVDSVEDLTQRALLGRLSESELEEQLRRAGLAFQNQRDAAAALNAHAGELLAVDQALLDEIQAATGEHQIPNERHLLEFVNDALAEDASGVVIPDDALTRPVGIELRRAFNVRRFEHATMDSDRATQFMRWAQNESEVALTFSREVAYRHPNIELIHAAHPLSRWAARGIGAHHHAFSIALDHSDALAKGKYVFALCFLESSNARTPLRVTGLVARAGDGLVSLSESRDVARVMGELLDNGLDEALPWEVGTPAPESVANVLETVHTALDTLVHEQNKRDHELHELREAAATARGLAGLRAALSRAEGLLDRYRTEGAAPFVTRMQEAKVARARERVEESERQPAARQWAEPERHDVAVGLISVRH